MGRFGPFPSRPRLAVAVSGGADSTALALLAQNWVVGHGGTVLALVIDHGLRPDSAVEANLTKQRLETRGIATQIIVLAGLSHRNLQDEARRARHAALGTATRRAGALFLLLGHQAADQSETVVMRAGRGNRGLEGMAAWSARNDVVLLRPLLTITPGKLREFLCLENMSWVEDPSNYDRRFERVRVRLAGSTAVPANPKGRQQMETEVAIFLACNTVIRPEGFAVILVESAPPAALAVLLRTIGGAQYAPRRKAVARLASKLQPATLGGVRILKAGRLGSGWLLVREIAACAPPIPAKRRSLWDGRFRLLENAEDSLCGAVGPGISTFRNISNLPAAALSGLPCIRVSAKFGAKPRLAKAFFVPPAPAASLPFAPQSEPPFA